MYKFITLYLDELIFQISAAPPFTLMLHLVAVELYSGNVIRVDVLPSEVHNNLFYVSLIKKIILDQRTLH